MVRVRSIVGCIFAALVCLPASAQEPPQHEEGWTMQDGIWTRQDQSWKGRIRSYLRTKDWDKPLRFNIPEGIDLAKAVESIENTIGRDIGGNMLDCGTMQLGEPLIGRMTPREALHTLLDGTCIKLRFDGDVASFAPFRPQYERPDRKYNFKLDRMPFRKAIGVINKWFPRKPCSDRLHDSDRKNCEAAPSEYVVLNGTEEEETIVGPLVGRYGYIEALLILTQQMRPTQSACTVLRDNGSFMSFDPPDSQSDEVFCECQVDFPICAEVAIRQVISSASRLPAPDEVLQAPAAVSRAITLDRDDIDRMGVSSVAELLQRMPQTSYTFNEGSRTDGAQYAVGRGAGPTLVLLNGRRMMASANSLNAAETDLHFIPVTAIERIKYIPDSSSTIHGLDAIGGILNIKTRRPAEGMTGDLRYGTARGGATERRMTVAGGGRTEGAQGSLVLDVLDVADLPGSERSRYSNQDYRRYGGVNRESTSAAPGNLYSVDGRNLPGLSSPSAGIPSQIGNGTLTPDLLTDVNTVSLGAFQSVTPARNKKSILATGEWATRPAMIFGELFYTAQETEYAVHPAISPGLLLSPAHPQNPFGAPVLYEGLLGTPPQQYQTASHMARIVIGATGTASGWKWTLSSLHSRETFDQHLVNSADWVALMNALSASDMSEALNLVSPETSSADLLAAPLELASTVSTGSQVFGIAERDLIALPAGTLKTQMGVEWRKEGGRFPNGVDVRERRMTGMFAQLYVPIVDEAMNWPGLKELTLRTGARRDWYEGIGAVNGMQHELVWRPSARLKVHLSQSDLFRVPSQTELYAPQANVIAQLIDARRSNESVVAGIVVGGNPDLHPTTAVSRTVGVEWRTERGSKLSADYWRVGVAGRVSAADPQLVLAHEDSLASRVHRAAPTDRDTTAGMPGRLISVTSTLENLGRVSASGWDVAYEREIDLPLGTLTPRLTATWFDEFQTSEVPSSTERFDRVGIASSKGTVTQYRVAASAMWVSDDQMRLGTYCIYYPHYFDSLDGTRITRTARHVSGQITCDLDISKDFGPHMTLSLNVRNLFDSHPGYSDSGSEGHDRSQGSLVGRQLSVTGRFQF